MWEPNIIIYYYARNSWDDWSLYHQFLGATKILGRCPYSSSFQDIFCCEVIAKKIFGYHPSGSSLRPLRLHSAQKTLGRLTRRVMANGWNMIRTYAVIKNVKNPPIISGFDGLENHLSASFPQLSLWVNPHNRQKFLGEDSMQPTPKSFFTKIILKYLKIISKSHFFPAFCFPAKNGQDPVLQPFPWAGAQI